MEAALKSTLANDDTISISTTGDIKMNSTNYQSLLNAINTTSYTGLTLDFSKAVAEENGMVKRSYTECSAIKEIASFPAGITSLYFTFHKFTNLTTIAEIPAIVTKMNYTFSGCTALNQNITIPEKIVSLYATFEDCSTLASTITIYGAAALTSTKAFNGITVPSNISLLFGPNRTEWSSGNTWAGYTFKSITSIQ